MAAGGSRNTPCFCRSGHKLKHCCARHLTAVDSCTLDTGCRWRFWAPHRPDGRHASEVAEHICAGERVWIARDTQYATSWMIDDQPVTLFEVIDHLPGALYHWMASQTMTALNAAAPPANDTPLTTTDEQDDGYPSGFAEIRQLMGEVLRLAHASDAIQEHLPNLSDHLAPRHTRQPLAS